MKTVNFLPDWYFQQQRQRRNLRIHLCIMIVLGGAMIGYTSIVRARVGEQEQRRRSLSDRLAQVGDFEPQLRERQAELKRLENVRAAYRELGSTVPMSAVIRQILNDMTPGMSLSYFSIDVRPEPVKGSGFVGDTKHPPRYHDVAHMSVQGISNTDVEIAQLIGKVAKNPLLSNCSLNFTRTEKLQTAAGEYFVRRFEIQMQLDLDPLATEAPQVAAGNQGGGGRSDAP